MEFTTAETEYIASKRLARIGTASPKG